MNPNNASEPSRTEPAPKPDRAEAKLLAWSKRDGMRRRARRIRRSVSAGAAALFATAFLAVYVQLASGHDPALSASSKTTSATSQLANVSSSSGSTASESESATSESATPVTTSQS